MNESYKASGVDVEAGYEAVRLMRQHVAKTLTAGVVGDMLKRYMDLLYKV